MVYQTFLDVLAPVNRFEVIFFVLPFSALSKSSQVVNFQPGEFLLIQMNASFVFHRFQLVVLCPLSVAHIFYQQLFGALVCVLSLGFSRVQVL